MPRVLKYVERFRMVVFLQENSCAPTIIWRWLDAAGALSDADARRHVGGLLKTLGDREARERCTWFYYDLIFQAHTWVSTGAPKVCQA